MKLKIWIGALAGLAASGIIAVTALSQAQAFDINGIQSGLPRSVFLDLMKRQSISAGELTLIDGTPVGYKLERGCLPDCDGNDEGNMEFVGFCEGFIVTYMYSYKE